MWKIVELIRKNLERLSKLCTTTEEKRSRKAHLAIGTLMITVVPPTQTHCSNGHEYTEENTYYQLDSRRGKKYAKCRICKRKVQRATDKKRRERLPKKSSITSKAKLRLVVNKPGKVEKRRKLVYSTPIRTREELWALQDPKDKKNLSQADKKILWSVKKHQNINWGLLGSRYPVHAKFFVSMKASLDNSVEPLPTEFEYTVEDFINFILITGLPTEPLDNPALALKKREDGFVQGNFQWLEKEDVSGITNRQFIRRGPFVIFNGRKYHKTTSNKKVDYVYYTNVEEREYDPELDKRNSLRNDLWDFYFGKRGIPSRTLEYIDPNGDPLDPFNLRYKSTGHNSSYYATRDSEIKLRQDLSDITFGYIKICLGCCAEWRVIDNKILEVRKGKQGQFGPCEEKHNKIKGMKKWKSATEVYKAGHRFQHVPLLEKDSPLNFQTRGDERYIRL